VDRHRLVSRGAASLTATVALVLVAVGLCSCGAATGANTITLYNGQHPQLTNPIVAAFEKQTGIQVRTLTNDGVILADQIVDEGSRSPADVFFTENSPELEFLQEHGLLAPLGQSVLDEVPSQFESPQGDWLGVALRISCLAYDPSLISQAALPASLLDLANPSWKGKLAVAPTDSDFLPLVSAVAAVYGNSEAQQWLEGIKRNAQLYQDDESVVSAVNRGNVAVGVVNQYYWFRLRLELGPSNMRSSLYYFPNANVGSLMNISGAGVLASSKHRTNAQRFVAFLASPAAQRILARSDDFEYPVVPSISANAALPPLTTLTPAVLGVKRLGDDTEAAKLLQQSGLD
jgi:iron(III) transport system substrate-binding protein